MRGAYLLWVVACVGEEAAAYRPQHAASTPPLTVPQLSRRATLAGFGVGLLQPGIKAARAETDEQLVATVKAAREAIAPVPAMLEAEEWDKVRTILKNPPGVGSCLSPLTLTLNHDPNPEP